MYWVNHCHILPANHTCPDAPRDGTLEHWLEVAPELKIERAVAFAPFPHQYSGDGNEYIAEVVMKHPCLIGCATIHPLSPEAPERLQHFVENYGFCAAKLHPPVMQFRVNDPAVDPYYAMAAKLGIPITFHTGVHGWRLRDYRPLLFDEVAERHPDLKIIMAHTGGTAQFQEALAVLQNRPNVFAELAQTRRILRGYSWHLTDENIQMLLASVGPHRIIYGCDWPWVPAIEIRKDIERIQSWSISDREKQMILGGNLKRVLSRVTESAAIG